MRLRREVHCYLDSIWKISTNKNKSRTAMYKWLATQMKLNTYETHIRFFNKEQCKQALKILKPKYKQLYGKNNLSRLEKIKILERNKL